MKKSLRICKQGHQYYKSTACPTCPICEVEKKPTEGFLSTLSAPARRALESIGIKTVKHLSQHTQKEILLLHGIGPTSMPKLISALKEAGLSFKA